MRFFTSWLYVNKFMFLASSLWIHSLGFISSRYNSISTEIWAKHHKTLYISNAILLKIFLVTFPSVHAPRILLSFLFPSIHMNYDYSSWWSSGIIFFMYLLITEILLRWGSGNIFFTDVYFEVLGNVLWILCILTEKSKGGQLCNLNNT